MLLFIHEENARYLTETDKIKCVLSGTENVSVYVIITARPLFRGRATPRGLSHLTDDDDDENEKQKRPFYESARRAHAHDGRLVSELFLIQDTGL